MHNTLALDRLCALCSEMQFGVMKRDWRSMNGDEHEQEPPALSI